VSSPRWWQVPVDPRRLRSTYLSLGVLLLGLVAVRQLFFASVRWELRIRGSVRVPPGQAQPALDVYLHFPRIPRRFGEDRKSVLCITPSASRRFEARVDFAAQRDTGFPPEASTEQAGYQLAWEPAGRFDLQIWTNAPAAPVGAQIAVRDAQGVRVVTEPFSVVSAGLATPGALVAYAPPVTLLEHPVRAQAQAPPPAESGHNGLPPRLSRRQLGVLVEELTGPPGASSGAAKPLAPPLFWLERCQRQQIYVGLGSEENLSLIALAQPRLAFLLGGDRRGLMRHVLHKALFEMAETPEQYLRLLLCREIGSSSNDLVATLNRLQHAPADQELYEANLRDILERTSTFGLFWREKDAEQLSAAYRAYFDKGLSELGGAEAVARTPYLTDNTGYARIRDLHLQNLIVPLPSGLSTATVALVGKAARQYNATISVLYLANGETSMLPDDALDDDYEAFLDALRRLPASPRTLVLRRANSSPTLSVLTLPLFLRRVEENRYSTYSEILSDTMPLPR
jgi:hypothetical protein